jgi:hypothetical protein
MPNPCINSIGYALHQIYDELVEEPLPEHWIALLNGLDANDHPLPERWIDLIERLNANDAERSSVSAPNGNEAINGRFRN